MIGSVAVIAAVFAVYVSVMSTCSTQIRPDCRLMPKVFEPP
jgi:hypothetical protein